MIYLGPEQICSSRTLHKHIWTAFQRKMQILIWKWKAFFCLYISWNRNQIDKLLGHRDEYIDIKVGWMQR